MWTVIKDCLTSLFKCVCVSHIEPGASGEGLQQHEEADRECTALRCPCGGGCQCFQVGDDDMVEEGLKMVCKVPITLTELL